MFEYTYTHTRTLFLLIHVYYNVPLAPVAAGCLNDHYIIQCPHSIEPSAAAGGIAGGGGRGLGAGGG